MKKPKILFVTYGAGHADIVSRLYYRLKSVEDLNVEVLALTTAVNVLSRHDIPFQKLSDLFPLEGYEAARDKGAALSEAIWSRDSGITRLDSDLYLGASMLDLEVEVGEAEAQQLYERLGRKAFTPVRMMEKVLGALNPDVVVTTCLVRAEKAALLAARAFGARTVLIEDLFGYSLLGEESLDRGSLQLPLEELPDKVVVMNDAVADRLMRHGVPADRVHPLGQPVFSEWMEEFQAAKPDDYFDGIKGGCIAYIAPAREDVLLEHARILCGLAEQMGDVGFYLKLHPSTPKSWLIARTGALPRNILVSRDLDLAEIIKAADIVVVFRSSVGLLTLMSGTPLVVFDHTGEPETLPYVEFGAAFMARNGDELSALIRKDTEARGVSVDVPPLFRSRKWATERIAEFLVNAAREEARSRYEAAQ